jgi:UDP-N-acetylglucosamine transferase subunit ALG13
MARIAAEWGSLLLGGGDLILVTIGTMLPFDRLVRAMDRWAADHSPEEVFAQIGQKGRYEPRHMRWARLLPPDDFSRLVDSSSLLVAHAGTGSYFLSVQKGRPIVMFPRRAAYREHTTDHQIHTARWLRDKPGVYVAMTEAELPDSITQALARGAAAVRQFSPHAPPEFLSKIQQFLAS